MKMIKPVFLAWLFFHISGSMVLAQRNNLLITTDIGQDPDDQQSLVRLLHYANEFNIVGLIANADANYSHEAPVVKDSIIHQLIVEYAKIEDNLRLHAKEYPTSDYLQSVVKKGCAGNGNIVPVESYIGKGHDTEGSDWILKIVKESTDPVYISVWGGACDLAQALWKARLTLTGNELSGLIKKLRVFFIGKQDSSNDWIMKEFPDLWLVLALDPMGDKWVSSYRGMFLGGDLSLTSAEWLHENVIGNNPLASQYPTKAYTGGSERNPYGAMKEGDSPSWLFFLNNGLNYPDRPEWGGWGGRFQKENGPFFTDIQDPYLNEQTGEIEHSAMATVFRWRPDFQNDFAARVQWAVSSYEEANHHPVALIQDYPDDYFIRIPIKRGQTHSFDASPSLDPDQDSISFRWYIYPEAGTHVGDNNIIISSERESTASVRIADYAKKDETIHLVLEVKDDGVPALTSYKRLLIVVD